MTITEIRYVIERDGLYAVNKSEWRKDLRKARLHEGKFTAIVDAFFIPDARVRRVQIETTYTLLED